MMIYYVWENSLVGSIVKAQDLQAIATTYSLPSIIVLCMLLTK
jgi:hypothetical protein